MKITQCLAIGALLAFSSVGLWAQSAETRTFSFGVLAGAGINMHSANFPEFASAPIFSPRTGAANEPANFTGANKAGIVVGGFVQYQMSSSLALQGRVLYAGRSGDVTTRENIVLGLNTPVNGSTIVDASSDYTIAAQFATLNIEPTVVFAPLKEVGLRVMGGVGLNLLVGKSVTMTEQLVLPAGVNAGFADAGNGQFTTSRTLYSGSAPNASSLIVTVNAGVGYDITVGTLTVTPELMYSLMPGNFADVSWNAHALRFAVGVRY